MKYAEGSGSILKSRFAVRPAPPRGWRGETPHLLGFCVSATRLGDYYRNIAI